MLPFKKSALNAEELLKLLQQRGLAIPDQKRAAHYLQTIGYYRLSAYFIPFKIFIDKFCPQVIFENILELYIFDRKLRLLALDPLERIEIAVRTAISDQMAVKYGPFWFLDKNLFENEKVHHDFITSSKHLVGKGTAHKSAACAHYFEKYGDKELPPSWVLIEELPMGSWSRLYANLKNKQNKRAIAENFDFKWHDLKSWLEPMTILRNLCAHHRRFWNISLPIKPRNLDRYVGKNAGNIDGAYLNFVLIMAFLKRFTHNPSWHTHLPALFENCPLDPYFHMHFPINWLELPLWREK